MRILIVLGSFILLVSILMPPELPALHKQAMPAGLRFLRDAGQSLGRWKFTKNSVLLETFLPGLYFSIGHDQP